MSAAGMIDFLMVSMDVLSLLTAAFFAVVLAMEADTLGLTLKSLPQLVALTMSVGHSVLLLRDGSSMASTHLFWIWVGIVMVLADCADVLQKRKGNQ